MIFFVLLSCVLSSVFSTERVLVSKTGDQTRPSVSYHVGRFISVYEDTNCGKPEKHICLNVGGSEELADDSSVSTAFPSVGVDSSGNIYVVWSDARAVDPSTGRRTWDIYMRRRAGNTWQPSQRINSRNPSDQCGVSGDQINPDVYVASSGVYVVWQSINPDGRSELCFAHSPDFGVTWKPNRRLGEGYVPAVAVHGSFLYIVFSDINGNLRLLTSQDGGNSFSLKAEPLYSARRRLADLTSPDISVSPTGRIFVVFHDKYERNGTEDTDVVLISSHDGGQRWSAPVRLDLPGDQLNPSVVHAGGIFIFYVQVKDGARGSDIYYVETRGSLFAERGEFSPTGVTDVVSGVRDLVVFQLKLTASSELGEAEVKTVRFGARGDIDDREHIRAVRLILDSDGNGAVTSSDEILAEGVFGSDDSFISLPVNRIVTHSPVYLLLAVDLGSPIPRGRSFQVSLEPSADIVTVLPSSSIGVPVTGGVLTSAIIRVSNNVPVVSITAEPSSVLEGSGATVLLDGSRSYDPDSDSMSFLWTQVAGPSVSLRASGATASFVFSSSVTRNETLVFRLTVSDSYGGASTGSVSVVVVDSVNEPPVARARVRIGGSLFSKVVEVDEGALVVLDASESYDPNGDSLYYFWSKISGPDVTLQNPASVTSYFLTPDVVGTSHESVVFNLSVRDSKGSTSSDRIEVRVRNTRDDPPIAIFSASPRIGPAPLSVSFDASSSFDYDGFIILYSWDFGDGSSIDSTSPVIGHTYLNPGEYVVTLRVRDSGGNFSSFQSSVTVLSSIPMLSIFPEPREFYPPYGTPRNLLSVRIANVSGEEIFVGSVNFGIRGMPNALFEFLLDESQDMVPDRRVQVFMLSTTSQSVVSVSLNVNLPPGGAVNLLVLGTLNPVSIPAEYEISVLGIRGRGVVSGVEAEVRGTRLPYKASVIVRKAAVVFSAPSTLSVTSENRALFFIDISANGANFVVSSMSFEYDPTKIERVVIFEDVDGSGSLSAPDIQLGSLAGEQRLVYSLAVPSGRKKRIGFVVHLVAQSNTPRIGFLVLAVLSMSLFVLPFRRRTKHLLVLISLVCSLMTCANRPGRSTSEPGNKDKPQHGKDDHQVIDDTSGREVRTSFSLIGVELSSDQPEYDVVGVPVRVLILR